MAERRLRVPGVEARAGKFPGPSLIPALNAIQERVGWLPRAELVALAHDVHRPLYEIEGLISFYPHFRTEPPKPVELRACHDLSCWLRGGEEEIAALRARYGADPDVALAEGSCLGRCDSAPACTVNEEPHRMDDAADAVEAARGAATESGNASLNDRASRNGHAPSAPSAPSVAVWPNDPYPTSTDRYALVKEVLAGRRGTGGIDRKSVV